MSEKLTLTDQEKETLQNYNGENSFLKALSEKLSDTGDLTENQISAYRKTKEKLTRCPNTKLVLNEKCWFVDGNPNENESRAVEVRDIRERAIKVVDINSNEYAWMPSKAVEVDMSIEPETEEEVYIIKLKSWFTKNDDFWKPSKY